MKKSFFVLAMLLSTSSAFAHNSPIPIELNPIPMSVEGIALIDAVLSHTIEAEQLFKQSPEVMAVSNSQHGRVTRFVVVVGECEFEPIYSCRPKASLVIERKLRLGRGIDTVALKEIREMPVLENKLDHRIAMTLSELAYAPKETAELFKAGNRITEVTTQNYQPHAYRYRVVSRQCGQGGLAGGSRCAGGVEVLLESSTNYSVSRIPNHSATVRYLAY